MYKKYGIAWMLCSGIYFNKNNKSYIFLICFLGYFDKYL